MICRGDRRGTGLAEDSATLKGVLREGVLQEKSGPSIATEFGVLLPGIRADRGTGATLAGILSQQFVGAIWQVKDDIAVDFGLRGARVNDHTVAEFRAGVTFAFPVP